MIVQGMVTNVVIEDSKSNLVAGAPAGSTVIQVEDAYPFDEDGGELTILGEVYEYASVDMDDDIITLSAPLPVSVDEEEEVYVYPPGQQWVAMVDLNDGDEGIRALIVNNQERWADGIRDRRDQESVLVSDETGRWEIKSIDEEVPFINGVYIDPETIPGGMIAPEVSPGLTIHGTPNALVVRADNVEAGTEIEYHISLVDGFTPGPGTLSVTTMSTVYVLLTMPDGTPLDPDTTYYMRAVATNALGTAPPSPQAEGTLDLDAVASLIAEEIVAGFVLAGRIQVGQAIIDANQGIMIPQPDGGMIHLPVNGDPATVTAAIIAREITIEDNLAIRGEGSLQGLLHLASGISKPTVKPTVTNHWSMRPIGAFGTGAGGVTDVYRGLEEWSPTEYIVGVNYFGGALRIINRDAGLTWGGDLPGSSDDWGMGFVLAGMCVIGSAIYVIGQISDANNRWYVYRLILNSGTGKWYVDNSLSLGVASTFPSRPALVNIDGTLGIVFQASNTLQLNRYTTPAGGTNNPTLIEARNLVSTADTSRIVEDAYWGPQGAGGVKTLYVARAGTPLILAFQPSKPITSSADSGRTWSRVTIEEFNTAWTTSGIRGLTFDTRASSGQLGSSVSGQQFVSYASAGYMSEYGRNTRAETVRVSYAWHDGTGTPHTTESGPEQVFARSARAGYRVETPPAPDINNPDLTNQDKANQIIIYAAVGQAPRQQSVLPIGTRHQHLWDTPPLSGALPPATNQFDAVGVSPAQIKSATPSGSTIKDIELYGDGWWRLNPEKNLAPDDTGWVTVTSFGTGYAGNSAGYTVRVRRVGKVVSINGRLVKSNGTNFSTDDGGNVGCTVPVGFRIDGQHAMMQVPTSAGANPARILVNVNGNIQIYPSGNASYISMDASWLTT
jgi:hypothetical protein